VVGVWVRARVKVRVRVTGYEARRRLPIELLQLVLVELLLVLVELLLQLVMPSVIHFSL
jgi:hypothetical protein